MKRAITGAHRPWDEKGEAKGRVEVARKLFKAGFPKDIIAQTIGVTLADLENQ
jgi:hypothetical protein